MRPHRDKIAAAQHGLTHMAALVGIVGPKLGFSNLGQPRTYTVLVK